MLTAMCKTLASNKLDPHRAGGVWLTSYMSWFVGGGGLSGLMANGLGCVQRCDVHLTTYLNGNHDIRPKLIDPASDVFHVKQLRQALHQVIQNLQCQSREL